MATNGVWERTPYLFGGGHEAEEHMNTFSDAGTFLRNDGRWNFFGSLFWQLRLRLIFTRVGTKVIV